MITDKTKAMVLASFAADALALGIHWIYDTNVIEQKWGRVEKFIKPERPTYHPTKNLGEFTHYGDQMMLLLESVVECDGFDLNDFANRWQHYFKSYNGYFDGATKGTLENFAAGKSPAESGSGSDDLAGAARIAPLAYVYHHDLDSFIASARLQTALTHNDVQVIDAAEYFSRVVWKVLQGETPTAAMHLVMDQDFNKKPFSGWIKRGLDSIQKDTRDAIKAFGQMCEIDAAFPCVVHLAAKYEDNLKEALVENTIAGGDSAGRGLIVGLIMGAHLGSGAIPKKWLSDLKAYQKIIKLLEKIERSASSI